LGKKSEYGDIAPKTYGEKPTYSGGLLEDIFRILTGGR
jgi:hypothetical protein